MISLGQFFLFILAFKSDIHPLQQLKYIMIQPQGKSVSKPNDKVIITHKQRSLIFTQQYSEKYRKKTFQIIYSNPIFNQLSFFITDDYQKCLCQNSFNECQKLKNILKESRRNEAKAIFEHLKAQSQEVPTKMSNIGVNQVLQPHLINLCQVVHLQNPAIVAQLLKHLKTDYVTFWIYGLYISKFPQFSVLVRNIQDIIEKFNLDIDLTLLKDQLRMSYDGKLLNIFQASFASVVNIVCKKLRAERIIQKLFICYYIKGRERKQYEVIRAALEIQI